MRIAGLFGRRGTPMAASLVHCSCQPTAVLVKGFGSKCGGAQREAGALAGESSSPHQRLAEVVRRHLEEARRCPRAAELAEAVRRGDRRALSSAITLCESTNPAHHQAAAKLLHLLSASGWQGCQSRLGISGPPGAGKSSLIEAVGMRMLEREDSVAVLAVDPTSGFSGGAILGDKTRMPLLSSSAGAFVRPSPTRGSLGGVTRSTSDAMSILEAAGFSQVLVETVGVGQSEIAVSDLVDCVVLVLPPSGGDELQAMKRGIMEVADILVVNKADGNTEEAARRSVVQHRSTLDLMPRRWRSWAPQVMAVSAHTGRNLDKLLALLDDFHQTVASSGELVQRRRSQQLSAARASLQQIVLERLQADTRVRDFLGQCFHAGTEMRLPPRCMAQLVAESFMPESR